MSLLNLTLADFFASVAAKTPTPGGGAVACTAGALAAAQAGMVVSYSLGRKDLAAHQGTLEEARHALTKARDVLMQLAEEDAAAYGLLNELQKLPPNDARRSAEYGAAVAACVAVPLASVATCEELARRCAGLIGITNKHLKSDLAVAAILLQAAAEAGACNVRINLPLMTDTEDRGRNEQVLRTLLEHCAQHVRKVREACA